MGKVVVAYQGQRCPESECQGCSPNSNLQARASGASQKACWLSRDQCFSCHHQQSGIGRMKRKPPGPLDIKAVEETRKFAIRNTSNQGPGTRDDDD